MTSRNYCFTINNYGAADLAAIEELQSKCSYLVYGKEVGSEGTPHLQGYYVLKSPARLAAQSKALPRAHIEIRKKSHQQAANYCKKDGDYEEPVLPEEKVEKKKSFTYISDCKSYEEACLAVEEHNPRDWYISGDKIRENLKRKFMPAFSEYVPIFTLRAFNPPKELLDWCQSWNTSRTRCLFLVGPTKLGKTAWARSIIQPHTYWKSMVNLDEFNPDSKLIIFDDFDWTYMPNPKGWLTQAGECTVTDKYRHKKTISVTMPAIYICNELPVWNSQELRYWPDNARIIHLIKPLFA